MIYIIIGYEFSGDAEIITATARGEFFAIETAKEVYHSNKRFQKVLIKTCYDNCFNIENYAIYNGEFSYC